MLGSKKIAVYYLHLERVTAKEDTGKALFLKNTIRKRAQNEK